MENQMELGVHRNILRYVEAWVFFENRIYGLGSKV